MSLHEIKAEQAKLPPEPDQMFTLAAAAVCAAKSNGRKKASSYQERSHILLPRSIEARVMDEEGDYAQHITHRFIGRIGRIGYRRWRMRLSEPYWVSSEDESSSYRANYFFEWTDKNVVKAAKRINVEMSELDSACGEEVLDYGLQPVALDGAAFQPDLLNAINQYESLSGSDCEQLIDDVRAFSAAAIREVQYSH